MRWSMHKEQSNRSRATVDALLVGAALIVLLLAGYGALITMTLNSPPEAVTNFDQCVNTSGGVVMMSYPERCMIGDKMFENTKQRAEFNGQVEF